MKRLSGVLFFVTAFLCAEPFNNFSENISSEEKIWVDAIYEKLSLDKKIGQLFVVRVESSDNEDNKQAVKKFIDTFGVGGILCFRNRAKDHVLLVNNYQMLSKIPLLVTLDAEWGVNMRLYDVIQFLRQRELGKIKDDNLIYEFAQEVARQCKRVGVHVNFAPVADVDNNPDNPVIATRSFGRDKEAVVAKCMAYIKGMQNNGVLGCIKHFPGHGDTTEDSHLTLPTVPHDAKRLEKIELYPFQKLIELSGVAAVMTAHLHVPALDDTPGLPTSLSKKVVTDLLQKKLGFKGLIFTDGLKMEGARGAFGGGGEVEVQALLAGNDILLGTPDHLVLEAHDAIKKALGDGRLSEVDIEKKVKKILRAKFRLGLHKGATLSDEEGILESLNSQEAHELQSRLVNASKER